MKTLVHLLSALLVAGCEGAIELPLDPGPGGSGGGTGAGGGIGTSITALPAFEPAVLQARVLLGSEYQSAIRDVLGATAAGAVTAPPDAAINGLTAIGASQLSISTSTTVIYERNAFLAAQAALLDPGAKSKLIPCVPVEPTDASCFSRMLATTGRRLFRRPLTEDERATWLRVAITAATAYDSFERGAEFLLAGLLQSPQFLYRAEQGVRTPHRADRVQLSGYEVATRLAFFVTGSTPSDALLSAAEQGELDSSSGIRRQAQLLLAQQAGPRNAASAFFSEFLQHEGLDALAKDPLAFPGFDAEGAGLSMRQETRRFLADLLFERSADVRTLFDATHSYVDANLAAIYGLPDPGPGFIRIELPPTQPRAGLLTHTAFLALMAHPAASSPTYRGKFVRERLLCETVAAPPGNVSTTIPEGDPNKPMTLRQKLSEHVTNAGCAACHKSMDPIGFGFESFDAIGRYRTTEAGLPIDPTGSLDGKAFTDAKGLGKLLKEDPRVMKCLTRTLFRQAAGHVDLASEARPLAQAHEAFAKSGYQYRTLLLELVASDAFRYGLEPEGVTR